MKKVTAILICLILLVSFAGCKKKDDFIVSKDTESTTAEAEIKPESEDSGDTDTDEITAEITEKPADVTTVVQQQQQPAVTTVVTTSSSALSAGEEESYKQQMSDLLDDLSDIGD